MAIKFDTLDKNIEKTKNMSKKDDGKSFCCYNKGQ